MKKFWEYLRNNTIKIINFEKKKTIPLAGKVYEPYFYHICKKNFQHKYTDDKNYNKVSNHCHFTGNYRAYLVWNIVYQNNFP